MENVSNLYERVIITYEHYLSLSQFYTFVIIKKYSKYSISHRARLYQSVIIENY